MICGARGDVELCEWCVRVEEGVNFIPFKYLGDILCKNLK